MIYDCFSFFNELDLLEIRLNVLKDVVDKFVLVEATKTHTGNPKPLYYKENKARFAAFADKIIHIIVDDFPEPPDYYTPKQTTWMYENWQRNAIKRALHNARPDDLIMVSDIDEIPAPDAITKCLSLDGVVAFEQIMANYYLNFVSYTTPIWRGTKAAQFKTFNDVKAYAEMKPSPYVDAVTNRGATASRLRYVNANHRLRHAGWHFSYLGGVQAIVKKIGAIANEYSNENNTSEEWVANVIEQGLDVCGCGRRFFAVPLNTRFPLYVREHAQKYAHLILRPNKDYYRRTYWNRLTCLTRGFVREYGRHLIPSPFKDFLYRNVYCKLVKEPIAI